MSWRHTLSARAAACLLAALALSAAGGCTPGQNTGQNAAQNAGPNPGQNTDQTGDAAPGATTSAAGRQAAVRAPGGDQCALPGTPSRHRVKHIVDGDTFVIAGGQRVRMIGINTPELNPGGRPEPLAGQARDALAGILRPGDPVDLVAGAEARDRHGRLLAHAFTPDGRNAAVELLSRGLAFAITVPPNLANANCYARLDAASRAGRRGVYGEAYFDAVPPAALRGAAGGFRRVTGRVARASTGRHGVWIDLDGGLTVKVDRPDMDNFPSGFFARLDGRDVEARGWIYSTDKGLRIKAHHPVDLSVIIEP